MWKAIERLVNKDYTVQAACEKIYGVYGGRQTTVTAIIKAMQKDNKVGGHPYLK